MHKRWPGFFCMLMVSGLAGGCNETPTGTAPSVEGRATNSPVPPVPEPQAPATARRRIAFVEGYRAGFQSAASQKKPMLLFFTAEWCHYCHQLAAEAFCDQGVVALSERFVCVLVDADREADVCRYFRVRTYPTIQFVSARGQILNRMVGKRPGHELSRQMQTALQAVARGNAGEPVRR